MSFSLTLGEVNAIFPYTMFGSREIKKREIGEREIEKKE